MYARMKQRPNHRIYLELLRRLSPEDRLRKAFELSDLARALFRQGLRSRFPNLSEDDLHRLYLDRLARSRDRRD